MGAQYTLEKQPKDQQNTTLQPVRIIVVGFGAVGKTSIVDRLVNDDFVFSTEINITIALYFVNVTYQSKKYRLLINDTADYSLQVQLRLLTNLKDFKDEPVYVFVFSDKQSYQDITESNEESRKIFEVANTIGSVKGGVLVRNKCDLKREVEQKTARQWAKNKGMKYFEVSAKTGEGLNFLFEHILEIWIKQNNCAKQKK